MKVGRSSFGIRLLCVLWPSFLMAGVMEMLVFSVVDPHTLQWFGGAMIEWSSTAVYTLAFFAFWLIISTASALTQLLVTCPPDSFEERAPQL
ncbi:MAG: hypothetical protein KGP14_16295 [Betaproteobacteria bacterium]|nr:hypothetical protein [Betaproteobacteria bacterium]